jgi:peptidoglycan/xylan/chitin deacetylase (PgdA/CDA1 family)
MDFFQKHFFQSHFFQGICSNKRTRKTGRFLFVMGCFCIFPMTCLASEADSPTTEQLAQAMTLRFAGEKAVSWGEHLEGVWERGATGERDEKVLALTFDACGSKRSGDYDEALISFLIQENIPATLFISSRWIDAHRDEFLKLAANPLFEIGNHGKNHRPLSTSGRSAYGIKGTADIPGVVEEVEDNGRKIQLLTGRKPRWFRSGTANYDEVAVRIVQELGYAIAGFGVNGDQGGTLPSGAVRRTLLRARPGDIVLCHMNRPGGGTGQGVRHAVPLLRERGFRFVTLSELIPDGEAQPAFSTGLLDWGILKKPRNCYNSFHCQR